MIKLLKFTFHISIIFLIIGSLYPGSLLGYLIYNDFSRQPNLIENQFDISINHFVYYLYVGVFGFSLYSKSKSFNKIFYGLFFLSIILEIMQLVVPNRAFQLYDLVGNFAGVLVAYFLVKIYIRYN